MANYYASTRTNYFSVKDPDAFVKFMKTVVASDDRVDVWSKTDISGKQLFGFGCYGSILGVKCPNDEDEEGWDEDYDYDEFVAGLSRHVAKGDAVIVIESGGEKLRYLVGSALIVTEDGSDYISIEDAAVNRAAEMLNNPSWSTQMDY